MSTNRHSHFWASYADLMTSLFFIMIVLFIISLVELKSIGVSSSEMDKLRSELDSLRQNNKRLIDTHIKTKLLLDSITFLATVTQAQIDKINEINESTHNLDPQYFVYDSVHKKHKLRFDVKFKINDDTIYNIPITERKKLLSVGKALQSFITTASIENPDIQYLLVIEGQASMNTYDKMDYNYDLSYRRAKNLKKYWDLNGIIFKTDNCEVLICGSGDGRLSGTGSMRELDEKANQRFLIHILPKPGQIE